MGGIHQTATVYLERLEVTREGQGGPPDESGEPGGKACPNAARGMDVVFTKRSEVHRIRLPRNLSCRDCRRRRSRLRSVNWKQIGTQFREGSSRIVISEVQKIPVRHRRRLADISPSHPTNVRGGLIKSEHKVNY